MAKRKYLFIILLAYYMYTANSQETVSTSRSLTRASFGESCDRGKRCDSRASLSCTENICQCVKPKEMTYDSSKGKCVVLSGERCSYTAVEVLLDQTQEKRWTEKLDCVDNAVCNNDGFCDCSDNFFEDAEGGCSPRRLHLQNCTKDDECRRDKHLLCSNGFCSCNETEAVFDPAYNQCVARVGTSCIQYERCVRNAVCPRRHGHYGGGSTSYNQCSCSSQYTKSKTGLCLAKYGMPCEVSSAPCSEEFSCTNGKCGCHFPDHQLYDNSINQCRSYVGGPCSEEIDGSIMNISCVPNSECKSHHDGIMECHCKDGFIESLNRRCSMAYGQTCGDGPTEVRCDEVANLVCKNGKCACRDFEMYDKERSRCVGLVGAKCQLNLTTGNSCTEGAMCQSFRDSSMGEGVCRCSLPSLPDPSRKCTSLLLIEEDSAFGFINGTAESSEEIIIMTR